MDEMVKFLVEVEMEVLPMDQDIMTLVPDAIINRFQGTASRVNRVTVTKQEKAK